MSALLLRRSAAILSCAALAACATGHARVTDPVEVARAEWATALAIASQESSAGRHAIADKALADYAARYPASGDAAEANFWRALYKLDPANASGTTREAAQLLDSYLALPMIARRTEALTLRRLVTALENRPAPGNASSSATPPRTDPAKPEDKAKDDEIARLKEELNRANAELERIKRRLAQPKP
jgi:hypothetical protein